jgi:hypothetical protein
MQALGQSNTLKLFCFGDAATMAFHVAINNATFIWEGDDDLHLGILIITELIYHPT